MLLFMMMLNYLFNYKTIMKTLLSLNNNFYPYNGNFIPQAGDNIFLDYAIEDTKFFVVKFRTIDLANNQIIISIEKI